jgi:hypothetical protein
MYRRITVIPLEQVIDEIGAAYAAILDGASRKECTIVGDSSQAFPAFLPKDYLHMGAASDMPRFNLVLCKTIPTIRLRHETEEELLS